MTIPINMDDLIQAAFSGDEESKELLIKIKEVDSKP